MVSSSPPGTCTAVNPSSFPSNEDKTFPKESVIRFRKGGPKSRNACIVCKIRHVKCDETRPFCIRCTSTGRKCEGYAVPVKAAASKFLKRDLVPILPGCGTMPNPSADLQGSHSERRSFHYFRTRHMSDMPGNFEPYFWESLVLQFSHQYPTVRQSLIALSAIYEEHDRNVHSKALTTVQYSASTAQQYNKAVRLLVDDLASGRRDPTVTLISCLIFIWIEFLLDDLEAGIRHLESGLKILSDHNSSRPYLPSTDAACKTLQDVNNIHASLDRSFSRLRIQAEIHGGIAINFTNSTTTGLDPKSSIPAAFANIFDSRSCLDSELNSVFKFLRGLQNVDQYTEVDIVAAETTRLHHLERLETWSEATKRMTVESVPLEGHPYSSGALYLQLYYTVVNVILKTISSSSEMAFDEYLEDFERVYSISESLMHSALSGVPMLSFDMCIIPPLFFLILKCRSLPLRRKAMALLELAPYQEGMWRRDNILRWCKWKVMVEEQGRGDVPESELLPESSRISKEHVLDRCEGKDGANVPRYIRFMRGSAAFGVTETLQVTGDLVGARIMGLGLYVGQFLRTGERGGISQVYCPLY